MMLDEKEKAKIKSFAEKGVGIRITYQTVKGQPVRYDVLSYEGDIISDNTLKKWGFLSQDKICVGKRYNVYFNPSVYNQSVRAAFWEYQPLADSYNLRHSNCNAADLHKLLENKDINRGVMLIALTDETARKFILKNGPALYDNDNVEKCSEIRQYLRDNPQVVQEIKTCIRRIETEAYTLQMAEVKDFSNEK